MRHYANDCPQAPQVQQAEQGGGRGDYRQNVQAKVYALTPREVDKDALEIQEAGIIIGMKP